MSNNSKQRSIGRTLGVILAGGAGSRLGGQDKGLHDYQGQALITWVIAALDNQVDELVLCINRNKDIYASLGYPVVLDESKDYQGPMAGIVAALKYLEENGYTDQYDAILVSSCDSPKLPNNHRMQLEQAMYQQASQVAVVHDGERRQNLHCLIKLVACRSLIEYYQQGGRAMYQWYQQVNVVDVDFSDQAERFANINFSDQLK